MLSFVRRICFIKYVIIILSLYHFSFFYKVSKGVCKLIRKVKKKKNLFVEMEK